MAILAATIANVSGRLKKPVEVQMFMPDFLGDRPSVELSLAKQAEDDREFGQRLMQIQAGVTR